MIDLKSIKSPVVMTPQGIGEIIGVDDKDNPKVLTILVHVEGYKLRQARAFEIEDVEEITGGKK
jgi:hypothetical protein